ncbi:hypothetical protein OIE68_40825 [Nocardia vinacea]|uniref:DUF6745 domain-containing protein n=1 Tax=Nocardia vinacea TaxID=96468 RepID=A0ABZ1YKZ7_9NOCA|nr:hypothetical protein OIE68_40825 [Nocardia vinacea]
MANSPAARRRTSFLGPKIPVPERVASACLLRDEWLEHGLRAEPSDRPTAQAAVTELYRLIGEPEPEFVWVHSPVAAVEVAAASGLDPGAWQPRQNEKLPPTGRIATLLSASRHRMDGRLRNGRQRPWLNPAQREAIWTLPPDEAAQAGVPVELILTLAVQDSLRTSLSDGVAAAIRTLIPDNAREVLGLAWYGQQDAYRVGYYDAIRQAELTVFRGDDLALLDIQVALARSTGWWWSLGPVCVMAERPTAIHSEPTPNADHNERRLHHRDLPAISFADGNHVYVQHGAVVPDWVVLDPTPERIRDERNIEVRRCAIERIGWDVYVARAQLELIAEQDDPGNPGSKLRLYDAPSEWGRRLRVLLAVNGSLERDGHRRRYGLNVPEWIDDPVAAAGWTYGLSGDQYAQLVRRT